MHVVNAYDDREQRRRRRLIASSVNGNRVVLCVYMCGTTQ